MARQGPRSPVAVTMLGANAAQLCSLHTGSASRRCTLSDSVAVIECRYSYHHPVTGWYLHEDKHVLSNHFAGLPCKRDNGAGTRYIIGVLCSYPS